MTAPSVDVAVVGAGIIGASCAWECARAGLRVTVIEAGEPGAGTTSTNMGQIVVEDGSGPEFALTALSARLWGELASELPPAAGYERIGTIWVARTDEEWQSLRHRHGFYVRHGMAAELLDAEGVHRVEPSLAPSVAGGLLVRNDAVVNGGPVTHFLLDRVRAAGGEVRIHERADALTGSGVRLSGGGLVRAPNVVNATGVRVSDLSPGVPVRPRKGHLIYLRSGAGYVRRQLIEMGYVRRAQDVGTDSVSFNVQPRPGGEIRVGSSRQLGIYSLDADPGVVRAILARAEEFMPGISRFPTVRTETGLRPASNDGLPLIGPWPAQPGVFLAAGHEGLGITMALATGRLIADQLVGRTPEIAIGPYLPRRVQAVGSKRTSPKRSLPRNA